MKYYKSVELDEHMLYASELSGRYNIYSVNGMAHSKMIGALISDFCIKNNIEETELFYQTNNGMARVYSKRIYFPAIMEFLEKNRCKQGSIATWTSSKGKNYNFTV